jgi:hypothetical protein
MVGSFLHKKAFVISGFGLDFYSTLVHGVAPGRIEFTESLGKLFLIFSKAYQLIPKSAVNLFNRLFSGYRNGDQRGRKRCRALKIGPGIKKSFDPRPLFKDSFLQVLINIC